MRSRAMCPDLKTYSCDVLVEYWFWVDAAMAQTRVFRGGFEASVNRSRHGVPVARASYTRLCVLCR